MIAKPLAGGALLRRTVPLAVVLYIVLAYLSCFLREVIIHDDHMYVAAAHLLRSGALYADFAYLQAPYAPYIYHVFLWLTGFTMPLLVLRAVKTLIGLGVLLVVYRLCRRLSGERWLALGATLMLAGVRIFRGTVTFVRNYDLSLLLAMVSVLLFYIMRDSDSTTGGRPRFLSLLAGVAAGLSVGTKLTYGLFPLCLLLATFHYCGGARGFRRLGVPMALGVAAGLLPALGIALHSGADVALYNNLGYHQLNVVWVASQVSETAITLSDKLGYFFYVLTHDVTSLLILVPFVFLAALSAGSRPGPLARGSRAFLPALLLLAAVLMYFVPTPSGDGYLNTFFAVVCISTCALAGMVTQRVRRMAGGLVWTVALILVTANLQNDSKRLSRLFRPSMWQPVVIHGAMTDLREMLDPADLERPVATMSPILALEAGLPIYPELSCGDFTARTGYLLSAGELERYSVAAPRYYPTMLSQRPPSMVIVSEFLYPWEVPLKEWAVAHDYQPVELLGDHTAYVR